MDELVSIVIPTYNASSTIDRCINSVINQTYKNIEIIIINDGSTDYTEKIVSEYIKKDNRIKLINIKNNGVSNARNTGIKYSQGKYIIFVDSDDYISKSMIEILVKARLKYNTLAVCNYEIFGKNMEKVEDICNDINTDVLSINDNFYKLFYEKNALKTPWGKIYDSKIIKDNNINFDTDISLGEDFIFNLIYIKFVKKICYIENQLYYYFRDNEMSLSQKYYPNMLDIQLRIKKSLLEYVEKEECSDINKIYLKSLKMLLSAVTNEFHGKGNFMNKYKRARKALNDVRIQSFVKFLHEKKSINRVFFWILKHKLVLTYVILKKFL